MSTISNVAVIGAGTMGNGIAQTFAVHGFNVTLIDVSQEQLDRATATIEKSLSKFVEKEKISQEEKDASLSRLGTGTELSAAADAQLVVEAIVENAEVKKKVFAELDGLTGDDTILASNTSSISITEIAAATSCPDKVIGMHFMNPVPLMKLVEVIRGLDTSDETRDAVFSLCEALKKVPVEANDFPGFVANRILLPMINEAAFALMEGVADREAIDTVMKLGMNHPMGPLTLADFIGIDVCLFILEVIHDGMGDPKYRPCPLFRKMVAAGHLGRKSGRGFYEYN
jgi:3-hydroxybutyryl-CoA dehydrogenase